MKQLKILFSTAFIALLLLSAALLYGYYKLQQWRVEPISVEGSVIIDFPAGKSLKQISYDLEEQKIISNANFFRTIVRLDKLYPTFKAGKYKFSNSISPNDIIKLFQDGKSHQDVLLSVTIPEGFTSAQIAARMIARDVGNIDVYKNLLKDRSLLQKYKVKAPSLEGFLYPSTYNFHDRLPTPKESLEIMIKEFFNQIPEDYENQIAMRGLSLVQAVTFASLIEKETQLAEEKPMVSEVIWNRLKKGSPLGIDAALIYGIEDYDGDIKWKHLKDKNNPYNTRIHKGLPPTPICSPAIDSLLAVLSPTNEGYYFYVKMVGESKKHHFSKTIKEHNRYVQELIKDSKK